MGYGLGRDLTVKQGKQSKKGKQDMKGLGMVR